MTVDQTKPGPSYRTGAAARLAGMPVETLRVWERRYGVVGGSVGPRGRRLYSALDVGRLALIKQLVDLGSPIGTIANLPFSVLREMRHAADAALEGRGAAREDLTTPVRVALVGAAAAADPGADHAHGPNLEIVARCATSAEASEALRGVTADVLAIELPALQRDAIAQVDELVGTVGARRAVVAYRFAAAETLRTLRDRGHLVVRAPLDVVELALLCAEAAGFDSPRSPGMSAPLLTGAVPGRRFDELALARVARAPTKLACECPRHVAELLLGLGAFERYSGDCENRNPGDAELHRYLQRTAGFARALLEDALARIAEADGLALTDPSSPG